MKDCHVHTNISHDGISSMRDYIKSGPSKGIDEIHLRNIMMIIRA